MHELQSLLLKKIPRLGELTFGCEIANGYRSPDNPFYKAIYLNHSKFTNIYQEVYGKKEFGQLAFGPEDEKFIILGHPFNHFDLLEALGEDYAITGSGELLFFPRGHTSMVFGMDMGPQWIEKGITLPRDLSDLSLPEYEETRKKLISLLK